MRAAHGSLDRRGFLAGALGLGGAVMLGACGGDDDDGDTAADGGGTGGNGNGNGGGGTTEASVGLLPITDVAPLFLARDRGTFADHGLEVQPDFASGGAVILPSVQSGEFDVGFSNIVSLLLIQAEGGDFRIVAGGGLTATGDQPDYSQLLVLEDSPLETVADLEGQRVAVNTLHNALELVIRASVDRAGGDPDEVQFREFPFPDMRAALEAGEVDAIQYNEPFQTILQRTGTVRTIGQPFVDVAPGEVLAFYFVKGDAADGEVARGFEAAMAEANAYAAEHEDDVRATIPGYTEVEPDVAEELVLPVFVEDAIRRSSLEVYADLMVTYGFLDEEPDIDALLPRS